MQDLGICGNNGQHHGAWDMPLSAEVDADSTGRKEEACGHRKDLYARHKEPGDHRRVAGGHHR